MKKHSLTKQERLRLAHAEVERTLRKTGYYRSLEKYGSSGLLPMPDLSYENKCSPTSDKFFPASPKRQLPSDAKQFPVQTPHKQGLMLYVPSDGLEFAGGKKS